jgi:S-adenosylmethionine/arginine decarboxylase-like enzyme
METYGKELILDLHNCSIEKFNRIDIEEFCSKICNLVDMEGEDIYFWDYEGDEEGYKNAPPHLRGVTAIQFIKTSNITIHTLDILKRVYLNIFSCQDFDSVSIVGFVVKWFKGTLVNKQVIMRI